MQHTSFIQTKYNVELLIVVQIFMMEAIHTQSDIE
jgi:hypothetical protein